jgi:dTDP-4-amino-4,6-dideoxygalactose transaminase
MEERDKLIQGLQAAGVKANLHYLPVQNFRYYQNTMGNRRGLKRGFSACPVADEYSRRAISLPIYPELKPKDQKHIIETLRFSSKA